ncbi:MAG: TetR/AcrR family transcriptional regulator [Saccharofermentans sp.]|nr:TetR/AcrR family transcriptional regulator [Saccharofermentans sp.]
MPKVTQEYIDKKCESIVDAAYRVCLRKPVQMVSIMDVINEAGLSQGAIYRYYSNLDEILSDMVTKMRRDYNIIDRLNELTIEIPVPFEEVTYQVCEVLGEATETHLMDIQKINFDLGVLAINEPERMAKIMKRLEGSGNNEFLATVIMPRLAMAAVRQGCKMAGDPVEIGQYLGAAYTGIEKFCILGACYDPGNADAKVEPRNLFRTYAKTIIMLFGGKTDE